MSVRKLSIVAAAMCVAMLGTTHGAEWPVESQRCKVRGETCKEGYYSGGLHNVNYMHVGDTEALNRHLLKVASERETNADTPSSTLNLVVLHPGRKGRRERFAWTENFQTSVTQRDLTIHVWLGFGIDLKELNVPRIFTVSNGGEVAEFIGQRRRQEVELLASGSTLFNQGGGFTNDPAEIKKLDRLARQRQLSMREITIRETTLFHMRIVNECMPTLPDNVFVQYNGQLRTDNGRLKLRVHHDDVVGVLDWAIHTEFVIFDIWLSSMRTQETVVQCKVGNRNLFVNVVNIESGRGGMTRFPISLIVPSAKC